MDVDCVDKHGRSKLHHVIIDDNIKSVRELVSLGANVNIQDTTGDTPLHVAAMFGHVSIVVELISAGANVNIQNNIGETPLYFAALHHRNSVVNELLNSGARMDIKTVEGDIPLHVAARGINKSNKERIESLMTLDSWLVENNDGHMPIDVLGSYGGVECVLSKAIEVDPSLRIFKDCIASLTYKDRRFVRETLLVLNRTPIPSALFPFIMAKTLEDFFDSDDDED
jgi:hypothetical protein